MYRYLLIALCLFGLTNCSPPSSYSQSQPDLDTQEIVWLVQQTAVKFKHGCFLRHEHSRVLFDSSGFTRLGMQFSTQDILEMDAARGLLVDLVEYMLGEINRDPLLCGQLAAYPFTADRLDIIILCESYLPAFVDPYYIGCIKLKHGTAYYYAADEKDQRLYSWHSRVERYDQSREFIMLERAAEREYRKEHFLPDARISDQFFSK